MGMISEMCLSTMVVCETLMDGPVGAWAVLESRRASIFVWVVASVVVVGEWRLIARNDRPIVDLVLKRALSELLLFRY